MKPANAAAAPQRASLRSDVDAAWRERSGRLFADFERPARMMVRRAFRAAFSDDEIDDIYSAAWVGALRALAGRHRALSDDEVRSYLLTAVANQASKELRRRRRKPATPLEVVGPVPDSADSPDERAVAAEDARLTRDLLASLPARRRTVMLLRYGWGLEPRQVCGLVKGLSPRAYRKEITRGVDELTAKMKSVESGEWCADREPILKAYAAGLADADQARQAQAHISHCRSCSEFVARLSGHLHDLGGAIAASGAVEGLDGHVSFGDRFLALGDRARDVVGGLSGGNSGGAESAATQLASAGGARGAGAAGAGILAKLAGLGTAGKLVVACIGGGAAATACIAAGVAPIGLGGATPDPPEHKRAEPRAVHEAQAHAGPTPQSLPSQVGHEAPPAAVEPAPRPTEAPLPGDTSAPEAEAQPQPADPVAPSAPPVVQEFDVAAAAQPPSQPASPAADSGGASTSGGEGSAVRQEFGP